MKIILKNIDLVIYGIFYLIVLSIFWFDKKVDAMAYAILIFYISLPVVSFFITLFSKRLKILGLPSPCVYYLLAVLLPVLTYDLANYLKTGNYHAPDLIIPLISFFASLIGWIMNKAMYLDQYNNRM